VVEVQEKNGGSGRSKKKIKNNGCTGRSKKKIMVVVVEVKKNDDSGRSTRKEWW
jgi:hypothetical protein